MYLGVLEDYAITPPCDSVVHQGSGRLARFGRRDKEHCTVDGRYAG